MRLLALALLVVAATSPVAATCGGGTRSTNAYFGDLNAALEQLDERAEAAESIENPELQTDELTAITRTFVTSLEGMNPPAEGAGPHEQIVRASRDVLALYVDLLGGKLDPNYNDRTDAAWARIQSACSFLEDVERDKGLSRKLYCRPTE